MTINTLFYFQYHFQKEHIHNTYRKKFHDARRILHISHREVLSVKETQKRLKELLDIEILKDINTSKMQFLFKHRSLKIYEHNAMIYVCSKHRKKLLFRFPKDSNTLNLWVIALLINGAIFIFYIYVMRRLHPLGQLKNKIIEFANGNVTNMPPLSGDDEIAQLSSEFNKTINKIKTLEDSRKLFLRNIMHELNTPIAKGKLISDLIDDTKNKTRLQKIFKRFEHLLGEFSKIERITSNAMPLNKKKYRMVDILDNAFDLLLVESSDLDIEIIEELEVDGDYELLSIALKNLIDNALKYGEGRVKITLDRDTFSIASQGSEIKNISFEQIFNRSFEDSSKGLGLGLYITYNILKKHVFDFNYQYNKGINKFIIKF